MIVVTGGAGFIGSALIWKLNQRGYRDIVVVDRLGTGEKWQNLAKRQLAEVIHRDSFFSWLDQHGSKVTQVVHLGACSSTTERDSDYLVANNFHYSQRIFDFCRRKGAPLIYASSAATYGDGERGFGDDPKSLQDLRPRNAYGFSKHIFDQWALHQTQQPHLWVGLKFFNVYGPNEYHKGEQLSVVHRAFHQIKTTGRLKLFRSYRSEVAHGMQQRDFVYVKDVVLAMDWIITQRPMVRSGIYNLGTGTARSFADLGRAVFSAMGVKESFEWIDMPESMRDRYQYFTQADMARMREGTGFRHSFSTLEDGVRDYVTCHLASEDPYL